MGRLMPFFYTSLFLILVCTDIHATTQISEILYYEGAQYRLPNTLPLSSFYENRKDWPEFQWNSTANYRGYVGTWEIIDGYLYLTAIDGWIEKETGAVKANLKMLFGDKVVDGRVRATGFTGKLRLPDGRILEGGFAGNNLYEREIIIQVESGKVVGEEIVDNTKNADTREKNDRLFEAINGGSLSEVEAILDEGADPNASDTLLRRTALSTAVTSGNPEMVRLLIENGADADGKALIGAGGKEANRTEIVRLLIENGADVTARSGDGSTALLMEAGFGACETVRLLVDHGADVNAADIYSLTPLMAASKRGNTETVRLLIEKGADVNAMDNDGNTALKLAANTEIVEILNKADAKGGLNDNEKLAIAVKEGNIEDMRALLDRGADVNGIIGINGAITSIWPPVVKEKTTP